MNASEFDYLLPPEAIAQHPAEPRDAARLLVLDRGRDDMHDRHVRDLPAILRAGDLLVVNDTRVRPARLFGRRQSGGFVEVFLISPESGPRSDGSARWHALVRPAKRLHPGEDIDLEDGAVLARPVSRDADEDGKPGPGWTLDLFAGERFSSLDEALEKVGRMPLPPYIRRERGADPDAEQDRERYQTVYAARSGAVAAPTAGLHFTADLLERLRAQGIGIASVTLHVGLGTFRPLQTDDLSHHRMHAEDFWLPQETVDRVDHARARGGRVIAVGTTSARVLESCVDESGSLRAQSGSTRIFIQPGWKFRGIDGLMTNFHLPRSTLLVMVSALNGRERTLRAYAAALGRGYRFYSYGDAMLIL